MRTAYHPNCLAISRVNTAAHARSIATPVSVQRARTKRRANETLIRALARAHRHTGGSGRSAGELAEGEGVTRSFVTRLLRLTLLAPDMQEAIIDGRQPKWMQLEKLTQTMPRSWEEQEKLVHFG